MMASDVMQMRFLAWSLIPLLVPAAGRAEPERAASVEQEPPVTPPASLRLSPAWDSGVFATSVAAIALSAAISVDTSTRWDTQLLPIDDRLKGRYSSEAANVSNILAAVDLVTPAALMVGRGFDREVGKRFVIYNETLLVGMALDSVVKSVVARPRPYVYSDDPERVAFVQRQGRDSHYSFYSRHASMTFGASVAGAYLFAQSPSDTNARATVWGIELALAAATADLRTRAGMHFYSDVAVGAVVGSGIGLLVPYLHGGPRVHLSKLEWLAIALGPLIGVAVGELLPVGG